jgi:hypothetical protein
MLAMTRPAQSPRLLLIADRPAPSSAATQPIRRFRLARIRLDGRAAGTASRYEHLKRTFD